jgi:hypothetical protein
MVGKGSEPAAVATACGPRELDQRDQLAARRRQQREAATQRALVRHLALRGSKQCFWFAVPNGGGRHPIEAVLLKACGVRAGVPDLVIIKDGRAIGLELKVEGGRLTDAQRLAHDEMRAAGATVAVAFGLDAAIEQLMRWGIIQ